MPNERSVLRVDPHRIRSLSGYQYLLTKGLSRVSRTLALQKREPRPVPIILTALPHLGSGSPTQWDPYAAPQVWIREMGHLLGLPPEGYTRFDYPVTGIMNGEAEFVQLKSRGILPGLSEVEANSILLNLFSTRVFKNQRRSLRLLLSPTAEDIPVRASETNGEVYGMSTKQLKRRAEFRIRQQLRGQPGCDSSVRGKHGA
jgi:hypothetical protein